MPIVWIPFCYGCNTIHQSSLLVEDAIVKENNDISSLFKNNYTKSIPIFKASNVPTVFTGPLLKYLPTAIVPYVSTDSSDC